MELQTTHSEANDESDLAERFGLTSLPTSLHKNHGPGGDVRTVQKILGHNDIGTTEFYSHIIRDGRAGTQALHWGRKGKGSEVLRMFAFV